MKKEIEFESKNQKDALAYAAKELNVDPEKITLEILKEKKGILGIGGSILFKASVDINLLDLGKEYLSLILNSLNVTFKMEARNVNNELHYNVETNENPLLIGKDGKCLDSINTLLRIYLETVANERMIVILDIGGYRENRKRQLEILATKTAKEVAKTKIAVKLKPMNSFERLIIHEKLSDWRDVYTESEGEAEVRSLVIKPKK